MTSKEQLEKDITILERNMESPMFQCESLNAKISSLAIKSNYEAFINQEISLEKLQDNNNRIGMATRKFVEMCSCMREFKR